MPLTDRSKAKEGGFAQVRAALVKFAGDVVKAEWGQWGGKLVNDDGTPVTKTREFLEITCTNVEVLETTEELSMPITEWNFRENISEFKGSFWVDKFLESADKFKLLIPDGLIGKRIIFEKVTLEATKKGKDGTVTRDSKFDSTNYIIAGIAHTEATVPQSPSSSAGTPSPAASSEQDALNAVLKLAVGKTDAQFRTAIGLDPVLSKTPYMPLAKAGALMPALVASGKMTIVKVGTKEVYQMPS